MSTPKAASSLLRSRNFLSPRSPKPKLLSPSSPKYTPNLSPNTTDNVNSNPSLIHSKICRKYGQSKNVSTKSLNIFDELGREENLILDSPYRRSLLNYGLNKCDLFYLIGKGSFGTVIKGMYKGDVVALKLVKLEKPSLNESNARFLVHVNIIRILDIVISEKYGLVIMEYYKDSKNLQEVLDDNKFFNIIGVIRNVASGLNYCHENGVLHLDIKPKNILSCNNSVCKICDFGNSVKEPVADQMFSHHGTVAYTAPEILKGNKPSAKCDIYSFGMLLWQLMSRRSPYESLDSEVVIYKVVKFNFRPSLDFEDTELSNLCRICWKADPSLRPSAWQICNILNRIDSGPSIAS